jgi:hypothetical protein
MRRSLGWLAVGLLAMSVSAWVQADDKAKSDGATCQTYGTSVQFEKTPSDAAKRAAKEEKLVMVLHVSGIFEDPDLT